VRVGGGAVEQGGGAADEGAARVFLKKNAPRPKINACACVIYSERALRRSKAPCGAPTRLAKRICNCAAFAR